MLRITFDRSALHRERFAQVRESGIVQLVSEGKLAVVHSGIFLTETLELYNRKDRREELREQIDFLHEICNGGIFRDSVDIWTDELIRDFALGTPCLTTKEEESRVWQRAMKGIRQASWNHWHATRPMRDQEFVKKAKQRSLYAEIRKVAAEEAKRQHLGRALSSYPFEEHRRQAFDFLGRDVIQGQFVSRRIEEVQDRWCANKALYPYFTSFVEGLLYASYYAAVKQNSAIDDNSQADIDLLTFLNHADVVVSSDTRFFTAAFEELWKPKGRVLVSPENLANFLASQ
ncbi:hypothetical protein RI103_13530 [Paraburkholderia sp. FT54]|uniref:hypothetical protein n=1 Tax=Paraburkholderia sp. FT54 TaxID=3074437 RepID=UPI0028781120|nr:hypothetical protein [Paraburkholderia sp. FT54]WNC88724.1 hypothetical protein RI103_13530 [Paraburkholderia sp. FT54]